MSCFSCPFIISQVYYLSQIYDKSSITHKTFQSAGRRPIAFDCRAMIGRQSADTLADDKWLIQIRNRPIIGRSSAADREDRPCGKATADLQKKLFKDTSDGKDINYLARMLDTDEMTKQKIENCASRLTLKLSQRNIE